MVRLFVRLAGVAGLLTGLGCSAAKPDPGPLFTASWVDLDRYMGTWYELARVPTWFERGCVASAATYSKRPDGRIRVVNACRKGSLDGPIKTAEGIAWIAGNGSNHAKLKVRFFWPFEGDYWILALDDDYRWALVGDPWRRYLWILARTPQVSPAMYDMLIHRADELGYDTAKLIKTVQPPAS